MGRKVLVVIGLLGVIGIVLSKRTHHVENIQIVKEMPDINFSDKDCQRFYPGYDVKCLSAEKSVIVISDLDYIMTTGRYLYLGSNLGKSYFKHYE